MKIGSLTFERKKCYIFERHINYYSHNLVIICIQIKAIYRNNGGENVLYNRRKSLWTMKKEN